MGCWAGVEPKPSGPLCPFSDFRFPGPYLGCPTLTDILRLFAFKHHSQLPSILSLCSFRYGRARSNSPAYFESARNERQTADNKQSHARMGQNDQRYVAGVAQGLERLTVAQEAVGSILIIRPTA